MKRLTLEGWILLSYVEWIMRFRPFRELHGKLRSTPVGDRAGNGTVSSERLCRAVDYACVFYFKRVLCLQRSSATALLLRRYGWPAEMVIGAQMLPFKSHAWCELDGVVINDKPYVTEIYSVLERC